MRFIFLLFILSSYLFSETFIKEYTYKASENDSKLSARKAALNQIKVFAIEEVGVTVSSKLSQKTTVENEEISKIITDEMETFSQAFTKTKILEEKWNGEQFYLKVEITVDANKIAVTFNKITNKEPIDICKDTEKEALDKLYDLSSMEKINEFSTYASEHEFNACHTWHYQVMRTFSNNELNPKIYRDFLLKTLQNIKLPSKDKRSLRIIQYLLVDMTKDEFELILANIQKMEKVSLNNALYAIASRDNKLQNYTYERLFQEAKKRTIGRPIPFKLPDITFYLLNSLERTNNPLFIKYYLQHQKILSAKVKKIFYKSFKSSFFKNPNEETFSIVLKYLKNLTPSSNTSQELYSFVSYCETKAKDNKKFIPYFKTFMIEAKDAMEESFPLTSYSSGIVQRQELFLRYRIKSSFTPTAIECGEKLFSEKYEANQYTYAKYLTQMGLRAKPAEKLIIKRLKKAKKSSSSYATSMEKELITSLTNMKTTNKKALRLIVQSLSSKRHNISATAKLSLNTLGSVTFDTLVSEFDGKEDYVKIRMIEIMSTFIDKKQEVIKFLNQIKSNYSMLNKVKKEAILELTS